MIARFRALVLAAQRERRAVAAFSCYDAEAAIGVVRAAEAARRPVILLVSARAVMAPGGDLLVSALRAVAERAEPPVCVQLDHAHDLDAIRLACECGVGAVMADGSHLRADENAEFVRAARAVAAPRGIAVEAALGRLAGDEELALQASAEAGELTEPRAAPSFVAAAAPDCLAVAVGNVHGEYREAPVVDLARLAAVARRVAVPLVLHGGSGLPAACLRAAATAGVAKVNFNTELREAYVAATRAELDRAHGLASPLGLHVAQVEAVEAVATAKLDALSSSPAAAPAWNAA